MASEHEIDRTAYEAWDSHGRSERSALDNWRNDASFADSAREAASRSQRSAKIDESVEESFPASDPPATQLPDQPPANADEKWKAAGITRKD